MSKEFPILNKGMVVHMDIMEILNISQQSFIISLVVGGIIVIAVAIAISVASFDGE
ncbi:hypothetical protein [Virgibacillus sp. DJP39]|uniref:hypothetical protein n=1 Tax=Virgibacillus sp. DJP39 TaxID=3409790 RepID=UPI003BB5EF09